MGLVELGVLEESTLRKGMAKMSENKQFYSIQLDCRHLISSFKNSATEVKKNARCVPKGFFRRFGLGFFMFGLLVLMLAGSCFLVYFFSYKEAYIVKSISESKNVAIKGWILSQGNLNDIGSPKGYLRNYLDDKNKNEE